MKHSTSVDSNVMWRLRDQVGAASVRLVGTAAEVAAHRVHCHHAPAGGATCCLISLLQAVQHASEFHGVLCSIKRGDTILLTASDYHGCRECLWPRV